MSPPPMGTIQEHFAYPSQTHPQQQEMYPGYAQPMQMSYYSGDMASQGVYLNPERSIEPPINPYEQFQAQYQANQMYISDMLENQMQTFGNQMTKNLEELRPYREQVCSMIQDLATGLFTDSDVSLFLYGSIEQGIGLDTSDIDIAIRGINCHLNKDLLVDCMEKLFKSIKEGLGFKITSSLFIETAMIPLIKLSVEPQPGMLIHVDLTISDAAEPEKLQRLQDSISFVQNSLMQMHQLKTAVLFLKKLLLQYELNDLYTGGLNSYSLVIMLMCFLRQQQYPFLAKSIDILAHFLEYYAEPKTTRSFEITHEGPLEKSSDDSALLVVRDPNDASNNTARGTYQAEKVIQLFSNTYNKLLQMYQIGGWQSQPGSMINVESLLEKE